MGKKASINIHSASNNDDDDDDDGDDDAFEDDDGDDDIAVAKQEMRQKRRSYIIKQDVRRSEESQKGHQAGPSRRLLSAVLSILHVSKEKPRVLPAWINV